MSMTLSRFAHAGSLLIHTPDAKEDAVTAEAATIFELPAHFLNYVGSAYQPPLVSTQSHVTK
jgi:hypothetical protein